MKVVLLVIDGFGIGEAPDAKEYGDEGSNTFLNTNRVRPFNIPNLEKLGLKNIDGINLEHTQSVVGNFARLKELSPGKDTTTGHLEMSGVILKQAYPTYQNGFTKDVIEKIEKAIGQKVIGGQAISGTKIIKLLGEEHMRTRKPIVYTSADSVVQIATHDKIYSVKELYIMCKEVREVMQGDYGVGRVIARPFTGSGAEDFYRLPYRKDFALDPPGVTMMHLLKKHGKDVVGVGKIKDIFNGRGITIHLPAKNNEDGVEAIKAGISMDIDGLIFANLNDTDMLYGHRNDVDGYIKAVEGVDSALPDIINSLDYEDVIIITGDHGCDPTTPSTDHSREYTPLLIYSKSFKQGVNLGTLNGFDNIAKLILELFDIKKGSVLNKIR
jgi:phosphopentomutase